MKAESPDRHGAYVGGRRLSYGILTRWYVCNECGGGITHRIVREGDQTVDRVACAACGCEEIISESKYHQQAADAYEVLEAWPELRTAVGREKPTIDAEQAIKDLFG